MKIVKRGASFIKDFQKFAVKGNVMDMAIGVIIGTAFGKIVSSLVADVIMPVLGLCVGTIDFKDLSIVLKEKTDTDPAVVLSYGTFIQNIIDFVIIAFAIFIIIKLIINLKKRLIKEEEKALETAPAESEDTKLLREIRDLLKK